MLVPGGAEAHTAHVQKTEQAETGQQETPPEWLTVAEYAERYRVNAKHLRRLCAAGQIHGAEQIGSTWRIPYWPPTTKTKGTR